MRRLGAIATWTARYRPAQQSTSNPQMRCASVRCASPVPGICNARSAQHGAQVEYEVTSRGTNHRSEIGSYHLPISISTTPVHVASLARPGALSLRIAPLFASAGFNPPSAMQQDVGQIVPAGELPASHQPCACRAKLRRAFAREEVRMDQQVRIDMHVERQSKRYRSVQGLV